VEKNLGGRTREVLDVIYRLGEVSAAEIMRQIPGIPTYSAVRSILRALEEKGLVEHRAEGLRYVYRPTIPREQASRTALARLVDTFFGGSPEQAMEALLTISREEGYDLDFDEFERLIEAARGEGR